MMTASMMADRYSFTIDRERQAEESEACICGYKLRSESDYTNNQNQIVTIMVCDSCGAIEHWVNESIRLIGTK